MEENSIEKKETLNKEIKYDLKETFQINSEEKNFY